MLYGYTIDDMREFGKSAFEADEPCIPFVRQKIGQWSDEQRNAFAQGYDEAAKRISEHVV